MVAHKFGDEPATGGSEGENSMRAADVGVIAGRLSWLGCCAGDFSLSSVVASHFPSGDGGP